MMTSSKKNVKIGQLLVCGAIILSTLQACQQKNEASSNSEDTITKITVQASEEEKSDKPQIENAKQVVDGAFPDGLDFSNITYGVIENMNGVHDLQTCLRLNKDSGNFIELKDYINGTTWVESSKKYEDVQKLKGRYLYLMPDDSGKARYIVYMNEITVDDVDTTPYEHMMGDNVEIDTQVNCYLYDAQTSKMYETASLSLYEELMKIGEQQATERVACIVQLITSENYQNIGGQLQLLQVNFTDNKYQYGTDDEYNKALEVFNFMTDYFKNNVPNLADKLNPYENIEDVDYQVQVIIADQYEFPIYAMYLLSDNTVRCFDYMTGNSWRVVDNGTLGRQIEAWREENVYADKINNIEDTAEQ